MERMTPAARHIGMMPRQVRRGLVVAGACALLGVVLAGCGSVTASTGASAPGASTPAGGTASTPAAAGSAAAAASASASASASAAPQVGCASVNQATMVTVSRLTHLMVPTPVGPPMATVRNPALVRALFRDFCNAVTHPDVPSAVVRCPADFGTYVGVFLDGDRVLARYTYAASGCQRVGIMVGSTTKSTVLAGPAAAAAPQLAADFAAVLHLAQVNPGGSNQST